MSEYVYATNGEPVANIDGSISLAREEVVRCRDCKYRYGCLHLVDNGDDDMRRCVASPDGFCSWGKPRGEGE